MGASGSKDEDEGKHLGQNRIIQLHPQNKPKMCLSYSADGLSVMDCKDSPDNYWLLAGSHAVERANADSGMAGSEATDMEDTEQAVKKTKKNKSKGESDEKRDEKRNDTLEDTEKNETKKDDTKKDDTKKDETKKEDTKNDETKKDETETETSKDTTAKDTTTKDDTVSKFQGHIGLDGFRFKLTLMDLIFLLLLLYVFYYML